MEYLCGGVTYLCCVAPGDSSLLPEIRLFQQCGAIVVGMTGLPASRIFAKEKAGLELCRN